jgi:hypothetical protein
LNAVLFLDYHRRGFDHPVITMPLNCYGRAGWCMGLSHAVK